MSRCRREAAWSEARQRHASRSISRSLRQRLQGDTVLGHVLAVFPNACIVGLSAGDVACLVLPQIGNGPLNVVVDGSPSAFAGVQSGMSVHLTYGVCSMGALGIDLESAQVWEPRPDWPTLRQCGLLWLERFALLRRLAPSLAPTRSLLPLVASGTARHPLCWDVCSTWERVAETALEAAKELAVGWAGDPGPLRAGASRLAGLGGGLTPAGDDFLMGVMLRAWLVHPDPEWLCRHIVEVAAPLTTALSAAFLRAAARGESAASWHALLSALAGGGHDRLAQAAQEVMSYGATSGGDALAGFIWAGLEPTADSFGLSLP